LVKESIFIFWIRGCLTEIWSFSSFLENGRFRKIVRNGNISVRQRLIQKIKVLCFFQLSKLVKESIFIFWIRCCLTEIWQFSSFLENGSLSLKIARGQN
jgi:hypothetical protein